MHGNDPAVRRMLDAKFPDHLPSYWHSKYEHPKPGEIIGEYVRRNDWPRLGEDSPFRQTQIAWTCIDDREQHKVYYPTKWDRWSREGKPTKQKWYSKERKANIKAMKDMRKKLDPLDPPTTWW